MTDPTYILKPHQQKIHDDNPPRALLALGTGTGKTLLAIRLMEKNRVDSIQVVCPKSLKEEWRRKHAEYGCRIPLFVATKEEMRAGRNLQTKGNVGVIMDESHKIANPTSGLFKAMLKYLESLRPRFVYCLSATPMTNNAWTLYGHAKLLGYVPSYPTFRAIFFSKVRMGPRVIWLQKKNIGDAAAKFLSHITTYTIELSDVTEVGDAVHEIEYVAMTSQQGAMEREIEMNETEPIVLNTKMHQIEQGYMKGDEFMPDVTVPAMKNDRILELAEEYPKLAVIARYNLQIDGLKKLLEAAGHSVWVIRGGVKDVGAVAKEADGAEKGVIILQAEVSEGYELPHFDTIVIASLSFAYVHYKQIIGRFVRLQHAKRPKLYLHLQVSGGIDEDVFTAVGRGEDYQGKIYERNRICGL